MKEFEVWRLLAKAWRGSTTPVMNLVVCVLGHGLCDCLENLYWKGSIDYAVYDLMRTRMIANKPSDANPECYWWLRSHYGAGERAKFCERMAELALAEEVAA